MARGRGGLLLLISSAAVVASALVAAPASAAPAKAANAAATVGVPLFAFDTGMVLTVPAHPVSGVPVRVAASKSAAGQSWVFGGHQTLRPAADQNLCLNVPGGARYRRGKLQLWACDGHASERFAVTAPSASSPVFFLAAASGRKLCVSTQSTVNLQSATFTARTVVLQRCANLQSQAWATTNVASAVGQFAQFGPRELEDLVAPSLGAPRAQATVAPIGNGLNEEWEVNPRGGGWVFNPVDDTADCLTIDGQPQLNARLVLAACDGSAAQFFVMIYVRITANVSDYLFAVDDARYCLEPGTHGRGPEYPVLLTGCPDTAGAQTYFFWLLPDTTSLAYSNLDPATTGEFQQFLDESQNSGTQYAMTAAGAKSGSAVMLTDTPDDIGQIWTDVTPGTLSAGNADGSISIRPLNEFRLCLTVPQSDFQAGVALQVRTCDGASDQEFSATMPYPYDGPDVATLSPYSAPGLCIGPQGGVAVAGSAIVLLSCGGSSDTWGGWNDWSAWVTPR